MNWLRDWLRKRALRRTHELSMSAWILGAREKPPPVGLDGRDAAQRIAANAEALEAQRQRHKQTPAQMADPVQRAFEAERLRRMVKRPEWGDEGRVN